MAQLQITAFRGVTIVLDYNAANGKVTGFVCVNNSGAQVWGRATLDDDRTFEDTFSAGETSVNLPANVVSVSFDGEGEATLVGLKSFSAWGPTA